MIDRIAFPDSPPSPMPTRITNARLNADHVWMGIADRTHSAAPERQDEVMLLLALPYLTNGISVEGTICVIIRVELEEGLAPVM